MAKRWPYEPRLDDAVESREATALIRHALDDAETIDTHDVDIETREGGVVVLKGSVPSPEQRDYTVMVAEQVAGGVALVADELRVDPHLREGAREAAGDAGATR